MKLDDIAYPQWYTAPPANFWGAIWACNTSLVQGRPVELLLASQADVDYLKDIAAKRERYNRDKIVFTGSNGWIVIVDRFKRSVTPKEKLP